MKYRDATAFRAALEQRLKNEFRDNPARLVRARRTVAGERLLARLAAVSPDNLFLKGGFALELRLADSARATKDLDFTWLDEEEDLLDTLLQAAQYDAGDHFRYRIDRDTAPSDRFGGSRRFRITVELAGRTFDRFVTDIGFDDLSLDEPDELFTSDSLAFAQLPPVKVKAISLERHVAEKIHAYSSRPSGGRPNTRVKDLVDMALIAERFSLDGINLHNHVLSTFSDRSGTTVPESLPLPPSDWLAPFSRLAVEVGLPKEIDSGFNLAATMINPVLAGSTDGSIWNPETAKWEVR